MVETVLASVVLTVCVVLMARLLLGVHRRQRLDSAVSRRVRASRTAVRDLWRWRTANRRAAREADEVIRRVRRTARREGNVIHPESFESPRKPH